MSIPAPRRKTFGYWQVVSAGTLLACILMNAITFSYQRNEFSSWIPLSSPPSETKSILGASDNQIWVQTQDGRFFTADISFYCRDSDICWDWEAISGIAEIPQQGFSNLPAEDCKMLRATTWPSYSTGKVVQCVRAQNPSQVLGNEGYYALMANGDVFYWRNLRNPLTMPVFFLFSTVVFPWLVGAIITALYLVIYFLEHSRRAG